MVKAIHWFIERLVERLIPIIASSFSSTVETMHALGQAEQQGHLEEAARRYEANGMDDVAAALRERSARLTSSDPGSQALPMIENLAGDEERFRQLGITGSEDADERSRSNGTERKKPAKARRPRLASPKSDSTETEASS